MTTGKDPQGKFYGSIIYTLVPLLQFAAGTGTCAAEIPLWLLHVSGWATCHVISQHLASCPQLPPELGGEGVLLALNCALKSRTKKL